MLVLSLPGSLCFAQDIHKEPDLLELLDENEFFLSLSGVLSSFKRTVDAAVNSPLWKTPQHLCPTSSSSQSLVSDVNTPHDVKKWNVFMSLLSGCQPAMLSASLHLLSSCLHAAPESLRGRMAETALRRGLIGWVDV